MRYIVRVTFDLTYKVLITTSGIGSRLGDLTSYTNKSLLPIGNKASLSWIVESYPKSVEFVITLGHFGEYVREYLQTAHPERNFTFVKVENFEGEGSSLALSMLHAEPLLQEPFIFHASDTIVTDTVIPQIAENWVFGFKSQEATNYVSFDCSSGIVTKFHPKGWDNYDFLHIGIVGINNFREFWDCLHDSVNANPMSRDTNDISALIKMLNQGLRIRTHVAEKWFDLGNMGSFNAAKKQIPDKFCVLEKKRESIYFVNNRVIKFFADAKVCERRVQRAKVLGDIVPKVEMSAKNFYAYSFVKGTNASFKVSPDRITKIMEWADCKLWVKQNLLKSIDFRELSNQFYLVKTNERLNDFYSKSGMKDEELRINGETIPKVSELLKMLDNEFLSKGVQSRIHGDFILDNLIIDGQEIKAIDWRQDFAGNILEGDLYYDLAKMMHSFYVNHEVVERNLFHVSFDEGDEKSVFVDILRSNSLIIAEANFIKEVLKRGFSMRRIRILTALVWLNMAALHHRPFDVFLYLFGKWSLAEALNSRNYD